MGAFQVIEREGRRRDGPQEVRLAQAPGPFMGGLGRGRRLHEGAKLPRFGILAHVRQSNRAQASANELAAVIHERALGAFIQLRPPSGQQDLRPGWWGWNSSSRPGGITEVKSPWANALS